jgi:hypothetical protein
MSREDPIMYEELPAKHIRSMMRSRLSSKPISSALLREPATTALGGRGSHLKALLMTWTYLPLQNIAPELKPGGELHGGSFTASALREPGERF